MSATLAAPDAEEWLSNSLWRAGETTYAAPRDASLTGGARSGRQVRFSYEQGAFVFEISVDSPVWVRPTVEALGRLLVLGYDWDSYGAKPIEPKCVQVAIELLEAMLRPNSPAPAIVPTSGGGVQLEWHTRGIDLEVDIRSPFRISACFEDHRKNAAWDTEQLYDFGQLRGALREMARRSS